jgi:hypothetical protein
LPFYSKQTARYPAVIIFVTLTVKRFVLVQTFYLLNLHEVGVSHRILSIFVCMVGYVRIRKNQVCFGMRCFVEQERAWDLIWRYWKEMILLTFLGSACRRTGMVF